jgi:hypothetical protein
MAGSVHALHLDGADFRLPNLLPQECNLPTGGTGVRFVAVGRHKFMGAAARTSLPSPFDHIADRGRHVGPANHQKNEIPKIAPWRQTAELASGRPNPRHGDQGEPPASVEKNEIPKMARRRQTAELTFDRPNPRREDQITSDELPHSARYSQLQQRITRTGGDG